MATPRRTIGVAIKIEGDELVKRALDGVSTAGSAAAAKIQAAFARVGIGNSLLAQLTALRGALTTIGGSFNSVGVAAGNFGAAIAASATKVGLLAAAIAAAGGAFGSFLKNQAGESERIVNQAAALGISAKAYDTFTTAVENAGLGVGVLDKLLLRGNLATEEAGKVSEKASAKVAKLAQSFRQISVTGADGVQRLITIKGTSEELAKTIGQTSKGVAAQSSSFQASEAGLLSYAKKIAGLTSAQARLQAVVADGRATAKDAAAIVTALLAIAKDGDDVSRAIAKIIAPLSDLQRQIGVGLDNEIDRLGTNLKRLKANIALAFDPAATAAVKGFADLLFDNSKAILAFANLVAKDAAAALASFTDSLKNITFADVLAAYDEIKAGAIELGTALKTVVTDIIIPAFKLILAAADKVAAGINAVFGTQLTGASLAAGIAILKLVGVFKILSTGIRFAVESGKLLVTIFRSLGPIAVALSGAIRGIGVALLAVVASNPLLAALVIAVAGLAVGIGIVASKQTEAEKAATAHKDALAALDTAIGEVEAGVPGAVAKLEALETQSLEAAEAALKNAQAQVAQAKALVEANPAGPRGSNPSFDDRSAFLSNDLARGQLAEFIALEKQLAAQLDEVRKKSGQAGQVIEASHKQAADAAEALAQSLGITTDAARQLAGTGGQIRGWTESLQRNVRVVDQNFTEAAIAARKAKAELEKPLNIAPANVASVKALTDSAATLEQRFAAAKEVVTSTLVQMQAGVQAAAASFSASFAGIGAFITAPFIAAQATVIGTWQVTGAALVAEATQIGQAIGAALASATTSLQSVGAGAGQGAGGDLGSIGASLAQGFAAAVAGLPAAWQVIADQLVLISQNTGLTIAAAFSPVGAAIAALGVAVAGLGTSLDALIPQWQAVLASLVEIAAQAQQAIMDSLVVGFGSLAPSLAASLADIQGLWAAVSAQIVSSAQDLQNRIAQAFAAGATAIAASWRGLLSSLQSAFSSLASSVESMINRLRSTLESLRRAIAAARAEASGGGDGFARGGRVSGPGTATSDSIPAWLSHGEYVIRAAAVDKIGPRVLGMINSGRMSLRDLIERFAPGGEKPAAFRDGGFVTGLRNFFTLPPMNFPALAMAGGGSVDTSAFTSAMTQGLGSRRVGVSSVKDRAGSDLRPANIYFEGQQVAQVMVASDALSQLERAASLSRVKSGGRSPSWSK